MTATNTPEAILQRLISIPSVNPMGGGSDPAICGETRLTAYLERFFEELNLPCLRVNAEPGRDNVVALLEGASSSAATILLEAHQDTVPVDGMTIDPFTPVTRDGRLHGRGACDVKGGMAAILSLVASLANERPPGLPNLLIACSANEEFGFTGAKSLAEKLRTDDGHSFLRKPDLAIVAEPTELQVVVAHKGITRFRCHTLGKAAHGSEPDRGENAIYRMARVLDALESYERDVLATGPCHALCGPATLNVGTITGGVSVNTVPDRCSINIDRRLRPDEDGLSAVAELEQYLRQTTDLGRSLEIERPYMAAGALSDDGNDALAEHLVQVAEEVTGDCRRLGVPYATDAPFYAEIGIPTVVFGPGSIAQAHTADEWIELAQLDRAVEILHRFVMQAGAVKKKK